MNLLSKAFCLCIILFFLSANVNAQQLAWANRTGGTAVDQSNAVHTDNAGNVYVAGKFTGTNIDFDPSPTGTFLLSSAGSNDAFVAKFDPAGQFIWAFRFGGTDRDEVYGIHVDQNVVYITGYFRGTNIDFDPGPGVANLTSNGDAGSDPGYGGDMFVAKYTTAGQYLWAFNVGGFQLYDNGLTVKTDAIGNLYVAGYFTNTADFDPSPTGTTILNSNTGSMFLAKYTSAGAFQWAFNLGSGSTNNSMFDLEIDPAGNVYCTGYYQGTNIDFDPSPSATALLSSNGNYEIFLAKYNTNGQYQFARSIGSSGADVGRGLTLDNAGNIYLLGDFHGSVDFDPGPGVHMFTSNGAGDCFFMKFDAAGLYQWAFAFGGTPNEFGWKVATDGTHLFITGSFTGTADMDPSSSVENLISAGNYDIFVGKYTLNGEYLCAFRLGGPGDDSGIAIYSDANNQFNLVGAFMDNNVDFDPTTGVYNMSSAGNNDCFSAKYLWPDNPIPTGTLTGNVICTGGQGQLTFTATAGVGPFTLVFNNGTTDITQTNVQSGVPFNITPNPTVTTTYTLVSIKDAQRCAETNHNTSGTTATVTVSTCGALSGVINDYTEVLAFETCTNKLTVANGNAYRVGDTVLLIQMKGAVIDSTNTTAFGTITDYKNAGNYEFNYVKSKTGNVIELKNRLTRQYDIPYGKVQLIRVPYYNDAVVSSTLTCLPWDGSKGGVIVFNVANDLELQANIDAGGKGFIGGAGYNSQLLVTNCFTNNFYYPAASRDTAGLKGESVATINNNMVRGKGRLAGAGGGGLDHNSGGGGGANGGAGGFGGYQLEPCGNAPFDNRGIGGNGLSYSNASNKIFMGSGGGAGHANNTNNVNFPSSGGNGGGIIIISAQSIKTNSFKIKTNGADAPLCPVAVTNDCHDGMGGGGAAGTVLLNIPNAYDNTVVEVKGGKGADVSGSISAGGRIGAGGGGGGGVFWSVTPSLPVNITVNSTGGQNGLLLTDNNNSWGTTPGQAGINLFNLQLPTDNIPFTPNIDSVRMKDSVTGCSSFVFKGFGYTNSTPIVSWQWYFGDGNTANTQNAPHTYVSGTSFTVKLIATDINGCKDSITKNVAISKPTIIKSADTAICKNTSVQLLASGGAAYTWTPAGTLSDPNIFNPVATPATTTTYYVTVTALNNPCTAVDSIKVSIRPDPVFTISAPASICKDEASQLNAGGGTIYSWQPSASLNNPAIANPVATPAVTTTYTVQIIEPICNSSTVLNTTVTVKAGPIVHATSSNDLDCSNDRSQLNASGALTYLWTPVSTLNNPTIANPVAIPTSTTKYVVKGTDASGCSNYDSVTINFTPTNASGYFMPNAFTPNGDGLNDCFGIRYWGVIREVEFSIYNRWGERIFFTKNPNECWDGTFKGVDQSSGVFVYMIRAKTLCGDTFKRGLFTLIR